MQLPGGFPDGGTVVLVDWPSEEVPRTLLAAGFTVMSANMARGTWSSYAVDGDGHLTITAAGAPPQSVDVVALFRPAEEHVRIVQRAVELGARTVWVQRGELASDARRIADGAGLAVLEGGAPAPAHDQ